MTDIKEQLSLPLWLDIICGQTATSSTFTMTYGTWIDMQMSRNDTLRYNIRRIWAGIGLIAMFAVPISGIFLL